MPRFNPEWFCDPTENSEEPIFIELLNAYLISFNNFKTRATASRNSRIFKGQKLVFFAWTSKKAQRRVFYTFLTCSRHLGGFFYWQQSIFNSQTFWQHTEHYVNINVWSSAHLSFSLKCVLMLISMYISFKVAWMRVNILLCCTVVKSQLGILSLSIP